MNSHIFEMIKLPQYSNLMLIPGFLTKTWTITGTGITESNSRTRAYDGDRDTTFDVGGASGSSGNTNALLSIAFPTAMKVSRIYTKGSMSSEEGGNEASHNKYYYVRVNGSYIYTWSQGARGYNGYIIINDDITEREGVTSVEFEMNVNYYRPEGGGGASSCAFHEIEIYGIA